MSSTTILDRVVANKSEDEAAWFAARRKGVTATDVAQLEKNGAAFWSKLLADKRSGERSFRGNAYTAWGLEREPVIAEWVRTTFGHNPSDLTIHAPNNDRFLATPDGLHLKDGLVTIAEYKTSKHDLRPGTDAFIESHYMAQCQWQMMVAGDDIMECLFVWEVREGEPGAFTAGERGHEWIERDNGHIAELVSIADRFLDELDNGTIDDPDDYAELVRQRVSIDERIAQLTVERGMVDASIVERIGDRDQFAIETPFGRVSYSTPKPSERFDSTAFKKAQPAVWREFVKLSQSKPSLRVTAVKEAADDVF